jgi:hypothetical protein
MREDLKAARREASGIGQVLRWVGVGLLIVGLVVLLNPPERDRQGYLS